VYTAVVDLQLYIVYHGVHSCPGAVLS
jgi:hypothetical protein